MEADKTILISGELLAKLIMTIRSSRTEKTFNEVNEILLEVGKCMSYQEYLDILAKNEADKKQKEISKLEFEEFQKTKSSSKKE